MNSQKEWLKIGDLLVEARLLEAWPIARCRLEECKGACCGHGVHLDLAEAQRIIDEAELIKPHLPRERHDVDNWFDGEVGEDSDFPTGWRAGTQTLPDPTHPAGSRCMFLLADGKCALQTTAMALGRHPWDLKPFYCRLFPVILLGNEVTLDDDNEIYKLGGNCCRAAAPTPLYQTYKDELVLVLGQSGYQQLCQIAKSRQGAN